MVRITLSNVTVFDSQSVRQTADSRDDDWYMCHEGKRSTDLQKAIRQYDTAIHGTLRSESDELPAELRAGVRTMSGILHSSKLCEYEVCLSDEASAEDEPDFQTVIKEKIEELGREYTSVVLRLYGATPAVMTVVHAAVCDGTFLPCTDGLIQGLYLDVCAMGDRHGDVESFRGEVALTPRGKKALIAMKKKLSLVEVVMNGHCVFSGMQKHVITWIRRVLQHVQDRENTLSDYMLEQESVQVPGHDSKEFILYAEVEGGGWPAMVATLLQHKKIPWRLRESYAFSLMQKAYRQPHVSIARTFSLQGIPLGIQLIVLQLDHARLHLPAHRRMKHLLLYLQSCGAFSLAWQCAQVYKESICSGLWQLPCATPVIAEEEKHVAKRARRAK